MTYQCQVGDRGAQPTLVVRKRASVQQMPQILGQAWGAIIQYAGRNGTAPAGPPFVGYHNMDMQDLDLEIGFPFPKSLSGEGEVQAGELPGGKAAECLHVGPYDKIAAAYEAMQKWLDENGHTPTGIAYEFYLNDPQTTRAEELQTQVVFPLK